MAEGVDAFSEVFEVTIQPILHHPPQWTRVHEFGFSDLSDLSWEQGLTIQTP